MVRRFTSTVGANSHTPGNTTITLKFVGDAKFDHELEIPAESFAQSLKDAVDVKPLNKFVNIDWPMGSERCWIDYNQDLDTDFKAQSFYYSETFKVYGWNCEITPINDSLTLDLEA